jgi:hypothetical protein
MLLAVAALAYTHLDCAHSLAPQHPIFSLTAWLFTLHCFVVQVVGGWDVVQSVSSLPFARPRDSYYDKPFFEAGKMMGDKRATVAEKRFNRPLKRVLVADAGVL